MLEISPPTWASTLSSTSSFSTLRRPTSGLVSSSSTIRSIFRPALDAAALVDAVDRHLDTDEGRLADRRSRPGQRMDAADLVRLGLGKRGSPWSRRQHRAAKGEGATGGAQTDKPSTRELAAPAALRRLPNVRHSSVPPQFRARSKTASLSLAIRTRYASSVPVLPQKPIGCGLWTPSARRGRRPALCARLCTAASPVSRANRGPAPD